jgi:hypothetical protein
MGCEEHGLSYTPSLLEWLGKLEGSSGWCRQQKRTLEGTWWLGFPCASPQLQLNPQIQVATLSSSQPQVFNNCERLSPDPEATPPAPVPSSSARLRCTHTTPPKWRSVPKCENATVSIACTEANVDDSTNLVIILGMMQVSKRIPFEDPQVLMGVRILYVASNLLIFGLYYFIGMKIKNKRGLLWLGTFLDTITYTS